MKNLWIKRAVALVLLVLGCGWIFLCACAFYLTFLRNGDLLEITRVTVDSSGHTIVHLCGGVSIAISPVLYLAVFASICSIATAAMLFGAKRKRIAQCVALAAVSAAIPIVGFWLWSHSIPGTLRRLSHYGSAGDRLDLTPFGDRLIKSVTRSDIEAMGSDPDPFVRVMAGYCIVHRPDLPAQDLLDKLKHDPELCHYRVDCMGCSDPVGDLVGRLVRDPTKLFVPEGWMKPEPNQAAEPSRTAVTAPADAGARASVAPGSP